MTLTHVSYHMPDGLRAFRNFLDMLWEVAFSNGQPVRRAADWDSMGVNLDGLKSWVGINFSDPGTLWFGTRCRIDADAAARLGVGELEEVNWVPGRTRWWVGAQLDSEEVHFFARSRASQIKWLEGFLRGCLDMARSIETPDLAPLPEVADENE